MADTTTKTLKLQISSDSLSAEKAFKALQKTVEGTEVAVKGLVTSMDLGDKGVTQYTHHVTLLAKSVQDLIQAQKNLSSNLPKSSAVFPGEKATSSYTDDQAKTDKAEKDAAIQRARDFQETLKNLNKKYSDDIRVLHASDVAEERRLKKEAREQELSEIKAFNEEVARRKNVSTDYSAEALTKTKAAISQQVAVIKEGENSITAIKVNAAEERRKVEAKLQKDIQAIQDKFVNKEISWVQQQKAIKDLLAAYTTYTVDFENLTKQRIDSIIAEDKKAQEIAAEEIARLHRNAEIRKQIIENEILFEEGAIKTRSALLKKDMEDRAAAVTKASRSIPQILAEAEAQYGRFQPKSDAKLDIVRKMSEAGIKAREEEVQKEQEAANKRLEIRTAVNKQLLENDRVFEEAARTQRTRNLQQSMEEAAALQDRTSRRTPLIAGMSANTFNYNRMIAGMSAAGLAGQATQIPTIPPVPEATIKSHKNLFLQIGEMIVSYRVLGSVISSTWQGITGIPRVGIELDSVKASLEATMGSSAGAAAALQGLDKEAERTGIHIDVLRHNFSMLQASTSLSGVSLRGTWKIFTDLNTVVTSLHLSTDKAQSVFLAITQIFNKSKVQSEELVKQLGNLLPGAFASFATSMGITTQELSKRMKAGTVFAQDTMEQFVAFMANRYAPAFEMASQGLNANLGRMHTSFTKLQEDIYSITGGPMNSFVKAMTEAINYTDGLVKGTQQVSTTLKTIFAAAISAVAFEVTALGLAFATTANAAKLLQASMAFVSSNVYVLGFTAISGAIAYMGFKADEASGKVDNLIRIQKEARLEEAKQKPITDVDALRIRVMDDEDVKKAKANVTELKKSINDINTDPNLFKNLREASDKPTASKEEILKSLQDTLNRQEAVLGLKQIDAEKKIRKAEEENLKAANASKTTLEDEIERSRTATIKVAKTAEEAGQRAFQGFYTKQVKSDIENATKIKKEYEAVQEGLKDPAKTKDALFKETAARVSSKETYEKSLEILKNYTEGAAEAKAKGIETFLKQQDSASKKVANERIKAAREETTIVKEYAKTAIQEAQDKLNAVDKQNTAEAMAIQTFYDKKKAILDKVYQDEKKFYEEQAKLAATPAMRAQAQGNLNRLESDYKSKVAVLDADKEKRTQDLSTAMSEIHAKYQDLLGVERDSDDITKSKLVTLRQQLVATIALNGEDSKRAKQSLMELDASQEILKVQKNFAVIDKEIAANSAKRTEATTRLNALKETGLLSDFSAKVEETKANEDYIKQQEKYIQSQKDLLAGNPAAANAPDLTEKIRKATADLENFKLTSNTVATFFENSFSNAFDSAFEGMLNGTKTAKQAFKEFSLSIAADIQKIIAQEMRSQVMGMFLKPLMGAAMGGLGSLFGSASSGVSTAAGNSASFTETMNASNFWTKSANGNVFASAGLSAHSGTIVNSPTVFPFAKGIGLMGEAGPEAILPLKRNSQGKLGVILENSRQSGGNVYNVTVTVEGRKDESPSQFGERAATAIMRTIAKEEIANSKRAGNLLNKSRYV